MGPFPISPETQKSCRRVCYRPRPRPKITVDGSVSDLARVLKSPSAGPFPTSPESQNYRRQVRANLPNAAETVFPKPKIFWFSHQTHPTPTCGSKTQNIFWGIEIFLWLLFQLCPQKPQIRRRVFCSAARSQNSSPRRWAACFLVLPDGEIFGLQASATAAAPLKHRKIRGSPTQKSATARKGGSKTASGETNFPNLAAGV